MKETIKEEFNVNDFLQSEIIFNSEGIGIDTKELIDYVVEKYKRNGNLEVELKCDSKPSYYKVMSNIIGHIKHLSGSANVLYYAICTDLPYITAQDIYNQRDVLLRRIQVLFNSEYKAHISKKCGLGIKTIDRCISDLVKADLLIKQNLNSRNGVYYVNPKYMLKGVDAAQRELIKDLVVHYNGEECFKVKFKL